MLKLFSNGVQLKTLFSLHFKTLVLYSTSSAHKISNKNPTSVVDYLVKSLGFSKDEAITASKKVSRSNLKVLKQPDLVIDFLKKHGFNNTQIKKMITLTPELLWFDIGKTLEPKFNALQELGIKGHNLTHVLSSNPSIVRRGLKTRIVPMISFLKSVVGSNDILVRVLKRSYWLMSVDVATMLKPNMALLRRYGMSNEKIRRMLILSSEIFGYEPTKLEQILVRVEKELGIPRSSCNYPNGIVLLASSSDKTRRMKYELFKSFGWTESDIVTLVRKLPRCLMLSEDLLRNRLNFFMKEKGFKPSYIASRPYVMAYNTEARVLPRFAILKVLEEKKLIEVSPGLVSAICQSEPQFLEQYVLPFKDILPELCEAYIHRKKGSPLLEVLKRR